MFAEAKIQMPLLSGDDEPAVPVARERSASAAAPEAASMWSLVTTVFWSSTLVVGLIGFLIAPVRPVAAAIPTPPVQAELLAVELTTEPVLLPESGPVPPADEPPPLLDPIIEPPLREMMAVAAPDAAVAFALPVDEPVRVVSAAQASFARVVETDPAPAPASVPVQAMVYGQGEGRQEAPEYPRQAKRERQEGAVGVKFSVGQNGRVVEAALSSPSPWPLLNESALKVIRDRWRFRAGDLRVYEVLIRFELRL